MDSLYNKDKMLTEQNENLEVLGKCKNLLNPTLQTTTQNGITCTNNGDGTYTLNGTSTDMVTFIVQSTEDLSKKHINEDLWLVGCPKNGSMNTYKLQFWSVSNKVAFDFGSGAKFRIENSEYGNIAIRIETGVTVNNLVFKPMLTTNLNATYDDFVPYTGDGDTLTHDVAKLNDNLGALGKCKNLLKPTLQTTTINGITCTNNGDGTYTLNGTTTSSSAGFNLIGNEGGNSVWLTMPADGKIIFAKGDAFSKIGCAAFKSENGATMWAEGIIPEGTNIRNRYSAVWENQTLDNVIIKPMLTTNLNATYDDFVPYTGDGETLASDVAEIKNDLGGLSFSASGTTLSITDGTHTWTLEANS